MSAAPPSGPLGRSAARSASSIWKAIAAHGPRMSHPATSAMLVVMIVAGIVLRVQNVGYPLHYCFDEDQFVGAAQQFLTGVPANAECCHPPLAKLLIGVGMLVLGNDPLGWRFMVVCFGVQSIVLAFLIGRSLFDDRRAGWLAAAFMAADGFFLSYSRLAFSEGFLTSLALWSILAAVTARGWAGVLVSAVLAGLSGSVKWSGMQVVLPSCFAVLMLRRAPWYSIAAFVVVPFVHLGVWMLGLALSGQPHGPLAVWHVMRERANLHLGFPHGANSAESAWYSWLVLWHPLIVKEARDGAFIRIASTVGNPVLWIAADVTLLALFAAGGAAVFSRRWRERWRAWFDSTFTRAVAILVVGWISMSLLWFSRRIVTYWYHYLGSWGFAILLLGGVVARFERRYPKRVLVFVALVLAMFIYFAPVWAELPISSAAAHRRLIFPGWW
jgi:dolichyl-phosphate-mannose-protein mannosyltransferase